MFEAMNETDAVQHPVLKAVSAIGFTLLGHSWGEIAAMVAALYTMCLLTEWVWKRVLKPLAIQQGWLKGRNKFLDSTGPGDV